MITHGCYTRTRHKHKLKKTFVMLSAGLGLFFYVNQNSFANGENYFKLSSDSKLLTQNVAQNRLFYTLKTGETVADLSKSQNINLSTIWSLNKHLYSSESEMMKAAPGQQIILPLKKLPVEYSALPHLGSAPVVAAGGVAGHTNKMAKMSPDMTKSNMTDDKALNYAAQQAASLGSQLQSRSLNGDYAKDAALGMAGNQASSQLQAWLQHYGTAEVNLQSGNNFDGSSLDFLLPFYDTEEMLAFGQVGARYIDSRFTANLGAGQRFFLPENMLGYNVFIDQDFSGDNTRLGIGGEYWRDYFKSSVNGYFRMSGWHESYSKKDYDERPVNGFDIRFNGYLPSYPALGAKLMYEQYYGDNVTLFNADKLQSNPGAATVGVNYTPVPLVTMGVDYRHGTGNENDLLYSMQFRYQFDKPWSQQIEPQYVNELRTLSGSRYDLVQRNNNIILEYKKQDILSLSIPHDINGTEHSTQKIQLSVKSKYGLDRIVWDDSALRSQGGQIQHSGSQSAQDYQAILPAYVQGGSNIYKVTARAYDRNGNSSNNAQLTITVLSNGQVVGQVGVTDFTADKTSAKADNADTITYTAMVKKNGVAQSNVPVTFSIVSGTATLGANSARTDGNGKATVTLKSNKPGQVVVSAKTAEMTSALNANAVIFVDQTKASITEIKADKLTAKANGSDAITYIVKVMKNNQPEANHSVTFSTNFGDLGGNSKTQIVKTDKDGRATVKLTSGVAGNAVVSAKVSEVNTEVKAPEVKFFSVLSIDSNVSIIGTSANGALPNIWLRYGQFKLTAKGGDGKYQWRSQDPSVASVDALTGRVTLLKKGTTTIEVVSGDNQTATYTINTPTKIISVETQNKVIYSVAEATCSTNSGRLPSSTSELKDVYNKWGAANSYEGYKGKNTITAWTQQTAADKKSGWTSTFDIVTKNEIPNNGSNSKVDVNTANAFAVCVR
ncbi:intimin type epsilon [Escherichia albertii]|uniref:Intimin n=3 Tax=Escherichia TaxID=561 RepID=A0A6F8PI29_ESCAL|nr:intimin type epsilon [Escherichia albertii]MCB2258219.1 intimin type epsilon [Escherichia albertii]MCB2265463.1 intimin type epsilon [Escherichia albertii]MCB2269188.1 intimin type epsilon [Escherichia albertii]BBO25283.1 intimin [Escherichia albertii]BBO25284.1 intimin [Escherichia albertii]